MTFGPEVVEAIGLLDAAAERRYVLADPTTAPGLIHLGGRLADVGEVGAWIEAELRRARGHRDLAGSLATYRFSAVLAELVMVPLVEHGRVIQVDPSGLWLELIDEVRIGDVALAPVGVVAGNDLDVLVEAAAVTLEASYAPVADAVRGHAPFGRAGMWGTLADHVASVPMRRARLAGGTGQRAWTLAEQVLDALAARRPLLRVRPRLVVVEARADGAARRGCYAEKGTCCLIYKADPEHDDRAAQVAGYACSACPLRDPAERIALFQADLARMSAGM
ncbi:MAG: hypothetical protein AB7L84_10665 [Acidimicrobiia bacterium]